MKSALLVILLVLSLAANTVLWYRFEHLQTAGPADAPHDYPLGENMGYMQRYAEKLWYAGQAGNWDLADYYHDELEETAEDIAAAHVVKDNIEISTTLNTVLPPVLKQLDSAIAAKDQTAFRQHYQTLIETCNACHATAKHPFIHIATPSSPGSHWNQDFAPLAK
jgi:hypothetical protein